MKTRLIALGALTVAATTMLPSHATTLVPACNLVTDPGGDAKGAPWSAATGSDPNMDIRSADIATNSSSMVVVWRMSGVASGTSDKSWPFGAALKFGFTVSGLNTWLQVNLSPVGNAWYVGPTKGGSTGLITVDTAHKLVRLNVPLSVLPKKVVAGKTILTRLGAEADAPLGTTQSQAFVADSGSTSKTYKAGYPSCAWTK